MSKLPNLFLLTALLGPGALSGGEIQPATSTCRNDIPTTAPESRFVEDNGGTTIQDTFTGLMWKRCAEGQGDLYCMDPAIASNWQTALQEAADSTFAGYTNWRLPSVKELSSLVEARCIAPAISFSAFRGTPTEPFWSSTSSTANARYAWIVDFDNGRLFTTLKISTETAMVRLVRDIE